MMSISQVDMVVWRGPTPNSDRPPTETAHALQVCGDLSPTAGEGNADPQSFTVVVRQGDNVATLHAAGPFDSEAFDPKTGRWELEGNPGPEVRFARRQSAVVCAVIILKRERAGLETLSWVQPVEIIPERLTDKQQLEFSPEVLVAQSPEEPLEMGHSVSSSLAILHGAAGGDTFSRLQRIDKVPQAHATPPATP
jgi:hypothetical protein